MRAGSEASKQVCANVQADVTLTSETELDINIPWLNIAKDYQVCLRVSLMPDLPVCTGHADPIPSCPCGCCEQAGGCPWFSASTHSLCGMHMLVFSGVR